MKNILVIDDDQMTLELLRKVISTAGYAVTPAYDGKDAIRKIGLRKPDLIISDIHMPNMDGVDVLAFLKQDENFKKIPIFFVTGTHPHMEDGFRKLGIVHFFKKPVDTNALLMQIADTLSAS